MCVAKWAYFCVAKNDISRRRRRQLISSEHTQTFKVPRRSLKLWEKLKGMQQQQLLIIIFAFAPPKKYSLRIRQKKIEDKLHSNFAFKLIEETKEFKVPFSRN